MFSSLYFLPYIELSITKHQCIITIRKWGDIMMNFAMMSGVNGAGFMSFAWLTYLLVNILLVLGIAALWKYVGKK